MTNEKFWKERPICNIVPECRNPGMVIIANKNCCGEHLIKYYKKQEEKLLAELTD